ncbi:MAG: 3-dehydroquinate synthase [Pirellulaceae bacterium]
MAKSSPIVVPVALPGKGYEISIASGLLAKFDEFESFLSRYQRAFIVTDSNVSKLYLAKYKRRFKKFISHVESTVVPAGERSKVIDMTYPIWQKLVGAECDRGSLVIALGGGVVGDLAGFAAATFMRGVDFLQIPTTLLAQVDSSVGGKVGINLPQGKNLVGAFWQPKAVWIDTDVLESLPKREFLAGLAEVIKYGVIMDEAFFNDLESNLEGILARDSALLSAMIARCCQLKADVVVADETETTGRRTILNFGHTYGHAFEKLSGYGKLLHGEAVAIGMVCAGRLASQMHGFAAADCDRLTSLLQRVGLPTEVPASIKPGEALLAMMADKKKVGDNVRLVLPSRIGSVDLVDWPGDDTVLHSLSKQ